ncbi:hypothetical protein CVT26_002365 [Gymnopilus dilepis]|uniref:F-box domain-containing protein n=1 Tax=Gymnopilus dilepis TaxID=231916 RepID=A0A409Y3L4_9AGAR|nr:hypothetical protein CVT26_002365 [Gymnopilus dilepis]
MGLPLELLVEIIQFVDATSQDGQLTLSSFGLTNRALIEPCQRRIFQEVEISYIQSRANRSVLAPILIRDGDTSNNEFTTGHLFGKLLATSPHIASYVNTLTVRVSQGSGSFDPFDGPPAGILTSEMESFSLYAIIPQLYNLKALLTYSRSPKPWDEMGVRLKGFLVSSIPKFPRIGLAFFQSVPTYVFCHCNNLEDLCVISLKPGSPGTTHQSHGEPNLRVLEVGFHTISAGQPMTDWFRGPYPPLSLSQLRILRVSNQWCMGKHIEGLLLLCSETLEELDIHLRTPESVPNLSSLHKLRHLTIRLRTIGLQAHDQLIRHPLQTMGYYPFQYAVSTLRSLPWTSFRPEQLHLTIHLSVISLLNFNDVLPRLLGWSALTTFLNDDLALPFLAPTEIVLQRTEKFVNTLKSVPMSQSDLTEILDGNANLRALKESGSPKLVCGLVVFGDAMPLSYFLANELLDLILDHLDADLTGDRQALLSCALANNALRSMAQQRIFRHVKVTYGSVYKVGVRTVFTDSDDTTGARFLGIVVANPVIATYVEELLVDVVLLGISSQIGACSDHDVFSLYGIASRLAKLQKFSMTSTSNIFPWFEIEPITQLFLRQIASRVRCLDIPLLQGFPVSAFLGSENLCSLRVQTLKWDLTANGNYTVSPIKLESLDIGCGMSSSHDFKDLKRCFVSPEAPFNLSRLRSLTISFANCAGKELNSILSLCSGSLEELGFQTKGFGYHESQIPSFASLHKLRLLMIQSGGNDVWRIASMLRMLPHNQQYNQKTDPLKIIIGFDISHTTIIAVPSFSWSDFADSLFHLNMTGRLKRVKLVFTGSRTFGMNQENIHRILDKNEALKALREKSIVIFEAI